MKDMADALKPFRLAALLVTSIAIGSYTVASIGSYDKMNEYVSSGLSKIEAEARLKEDLSGPFYRAGAPGRFLYKTIN